MLGTFVNAGAIVLGGLIGLIFKKGLSKGMEDTIHKALGISILILGLNGAIGAMFTVKDGRLSSSGELLLIVSLVAGGAAGELLKLEDRFERFGRFVEGKTRLSGFSRGFVTAAIVYCVGAMAIIGALNDGLRGDSGVLLIKSLLDGISSVILGATLGVGGLFSCIPVFLYQGAISLFAGLISPYLADELLHGLYMVGYAIVMCIGINFLGLTKIRITNLLPALLVPVLYFAAKQLLG